MVCVGGHNYFFIVKGGHAIKRFWTIALKPLLAKVLSAQIFII